MPASRAADDPDHAAASGVAVLDRAFEILRVFKPGDLSLSLTQIAHQTGFYKSTVLRLTTALCHHGMMMRLEDGRYSLGPATLRFGALYQQGLRLSDVMLPLMRHVQELSNESIAFYVRQGELRVCLFRVESTHAIRDHVMEGDILPMDRGSGGRVLMAFSGADGELFDRIRRDGYYISLGDRDPEVVGISVPIFSAANRSAAGVAGSLTLAGPRSRVSEPMLRLMRAPMLSAALKASESLSGDTAQLRAMHAACVGP